MPMQESLQLAGAIVERRGKRLADLPELTPLLRFTRGNPLTILVTLGDALRYMGNPEAEWCLAAVRGLTRERGIALLDQAAEIGLLHAHGGGYYGIHPALPWYFRTLFARDFPEETGDANRARRAFVEAMGQLGSFYHGKYEEGGREVLSAVMAEEDNLLAAWRL